MILINNPKLYVPNNIVFRMTSSKLLESFKNTQHFVLTEMEYGQYDFSRTAKEIALLYCDAAFKSLLLIERIFIETEQKKVDEILVANILKVLLSQFEYTMEVTTLRDDIFNSEYVGLWKKVHSPISKIIERVVEDTNDKNIDEAFKQIVLILIDSMDSLRFEQNEIDYLLNNGELPFLNVVDLCPISATYLSSTIIVTRAKEYNKFMGKNVSYKLKNYASSYTYYKFCVDSLHKAGISIIGEEKAKDVT